MTETSGADAASRWAFLRLPVGKLALPAICIYLLLVAAPLIPIPPTYGPIAVWSGSLLATLLLAALSVMLLINGARLQLSVAHEVALLTVSAGLWLGLARLAGLSHLNRLLISPVATVVFLLTCLWLGRVISRLFRTSSILLPACAAVALADIYTVYAGPTGMMLQINPEFVQSVSVAIPEIGSAVGAEGLSGLAVSNFIGLGDFIFLAALLAAAAKFRFKLVRTAWLVLAAAAVGMAIQWLVPALIGVPLLPFIATGFAWANWNQFHLTKEEKQATGIAALIIGLLVVVIWILVRVL